MTRVNLRTSPTSLQAMVSCYSNRPSFVNREGFSSSVVKAMAAGDDWVPYGLENNVRNVLEGSRRRVLGRLKSLFEWPLKELEG
ncbi:MAG: hypothetical protein V1689_03960 [Pseudomonadota bacterium]